MIQAIYNDDEIAFKVGWDDPSFDPALKEKIKIETSPPPPIPEHLKGIKEDEPIEPVIPEYPDALALQFASNKGTVKPYFLNGDPDHPVNLWKWTSSKNEASEWNATGLKNWNSQENPSQKVAIQSSYEYGRYSLVLKRKLKANDKKLNIQFDSGETIPIAFNVWDGYSGDTGTKKSISSWFELQLIK